MPTPSDINLLENDFQKIYLIQAVECCRGSAMVDSLRSFGYQYLGVIIGRQRHIYINAFTSGSEARYKKDSIDLAKHALVACDGGTSFWGALFNMKNKAFSSLAFNGQG